ncbi:LCP family protein [Clostridium amazonitimonense]|uniref:LCP family protein n=1 Tax=Clostridium amazonitimonense TaxID=1499689 RepID=UPI000A67B1BC|nr:LCP family protein [Clostridium amazonitimonense]
MRVNGEEKKVKNNKLSKSKILYTTLFILLCFIFMSGLYVYNATNKLNESIKKQAKDIKPVEASGGDPINILLLGVDIGDPNMKDNDTIKRTDTIMLLHYNPKGKDVKLVSIPRDTLIQINGKDLKINSAYAFGGAKKTIAVVEKMLNTNINYYAKVDYNAFRSFIDAIGGVDMVIERDMKYDDEGQDLHIDFKKGETVHLDGKKAEEFFRWRKNNDGTGLAEGDLGRIKNQHIFMEKVLEKVKSPMIVTKIGKILSAMAENVETNMPVGSMVKYGYKAIGLSSENVKLSTLEGDPAYIKGISYFVYKEKRNEDLLTSLKAVAKSSSNNKGTNKSELKVKILNGTNVSGLAKNYSDTLKNLGYNNVIIGNGEKTSESKVYINKDKQSLKSIVKEDFNIKNIEFVSEKQGDFDIIILLGEDKKTLKVN